MNLTTVTVVADTVSPAGKRITTLELKYPRIVHSELMTHRAFSRNASSSRAIPVEKMIADVRENMFVPEYWGKNQAGMQAKEEITGDRKDHCKYLWIEAAENAMYSAKKMSDFGVHKQLANRLLEPFQYIRVLVTATEWDNWFSLRDHEDAQPEIQHLAKLMKVAMDESDPVEEAWHLPYVTRDEQLKIYEHSNGWAGFYEMAQISSARCCRISYMKHNGDKPNTEDDLKLFGKLTCGDRLHASALEHPCIAFGSSTETSRNFVGFMQFREMYEEQFSE